MSKKSILTYPFSLVYGGEMLKMASAGRNLTLHPHKTPYMFSVLHKSFVILHKMDLNRLAYYPILIFDMQKKGFTHPLMYIILEKQYFFISESNGKGT